MLRMTFTRWAMAVATAMLATAPALSQQIGPAPAKSSWIADVIAIVLVLCVVVVSFMSSKRGHRD